jgi:phage shock protein A
VALQLGALRDALAEAGASPDLARRAAEEVAGYEHRFIGVEQKIDALDRKLEQRSNQLDRRIDALDGKMEQRFAVLDGKLDKLFWAISTIGALTVLTLGKVWFG